MIMQEFVIKGFGMIKVKGCDIGVIVILCRFVIVVLVNKNKIGHNLRNFSYKSGFSGTRPSGDSYQLNDLGFLIQAAFHGLYYPRGAVAGSTGFPFLYTKKKTLAVFSIGLIPSRPRTEPAFTLSPTST